MKRYNWEYNGEKMGLIEREDGICVLWSDVRPLLNQDIIALRSRVKELEDALSAISGGQVSLTARDMAYIAEQACNGVE